MMRLRPAMQISGVQLVCCDYSVHVVDNLPEKKLERDYMRFLQMSRWKSRN
jgi:hypothetical protein